MSSYTRLGAHIWSWEPWTSLVTPGMDDRERFVASNARLLWLALYTSTEAKRIVPGLFHGSITAMAEAARMPVGDVRDALDRLLERELAEYDLKLRVLRLTELPDAGESPPNGKVIRSWFTRWKSVPACQVRDAHVPVLRWIMEEWSRENCKPISANHEEAWAETFALVQVPAPRRRGVRRLMESDTGTSVQPGLFDPPAPSPSGASSPDAAESASNGVDTVSGGLGTLAEAHSVDNSDSLHQLNKITGPETVSDTVSKRSGSGSGTGSRSGSFLSSSGDQRAPCASGSSTEPPVDRDLEAPTRPHLVLVPAEVPPSGRTPEQLLRALGGERGGLVREGTSAALYATIEELDAAGVGDHDLAFLGTAARGIPSAQIQQIPGDPRSRLSVWVAQPGNVLRALADAREHVRVADARSQALRENMLASGMLKETVH